MSSTGMLDEYDGASDSSVFLEEDDGNNNRTTHDAAHAERKTLAKRETKAVSYLRCMVMIALFLTAVGVSLGVYVVTRNDQHDDFENQYDATSSKVLESFHTAVASNLDALDTFSASITSFAGRTGSTFPNVTIPDYDIRGASVRILSDAIFLNYCPLVTDDNRKSWEAYASANRGHLLPNFANAMKWKAIQDAKYGYTDEANQNRNLQLESVQQSYREEIWGTAGIGETEAPNTGPYCPMWQGSPVLPLINMLNLNQLDLVAFNGPFMQTLENGEASFGQITYLDDPNDENNELVAVFNAYLGMGQYRHNAAEFAGDPISALSYPVFDTVAAGERKVVGVLYTALYWRFYLVDLLSPSVKGVIVVLENNFNTSATYRVDGPDVTFLGPKDLHDPKYDHLEVYEDIAEHLKAMAGPMSRSFTSVNLNDGYISYKIRIYPSDDMKDQFVNRDPIWYTVTVASIFLFTSLVFFFYDHVVERRQKLVLDKAVKSTAVVRSLFPKSVEERIFNEAEAKKAKKKSSQDDWLVGGHGAEKNKGIPIADSFEETTVLFADLAGFTQWSANRQPEEVFTMLETIYGSFDAIALRRGVFKVETIGDCYMAVTGLPEPQSDHAVIMAKFARDISLKLLQKTQEMEELSCSLNTGELALRVGLHSGPVTAGVLRGEKSRFQLFGDTVNVASRMESNGEKGRVHCSQATADRLILAGKQAWVTPREGMITPKGKGAMQTYWIEMSSAKSVKSSLSHSFFEDQTAVMKRKRSGAVKTIQEKQRRRSENEDVLKGLEGLEELQNSEKNKKKKKKKRDGSKHKRSSGGRRDENGEEDKEKRKKKRKKSKDRRSKRNNQGEQSDVGNESDTGGTEEESSSEDMKKKRGKDIVKASKEADEFDVENDSGRGSVKRKNSDHKRKSRKNKHKGTKQTERADKTNENQEISEVEDEGGDKLEADDSQGDTSNTTKSSQQS